MRADNDAFLSSLARLFSRASSSSSASVYVSFKRLTLPGGTSPTCLARLAVGSSKVSTIVAQANIPKFTDAYMNICKVHMTALKRKEKIKKKKTKAAAAEV